MVNGKREAVALELVKLKALKLATMVRTNKRVRFASFGDGALEPANNFGFRAI
eukprot:CAMPEP_0173385346 /NCGR_PEP_ID=MMETSP1356-20130122/7944_1 /TAXON_ID=77927 ORGANISM="Hemiselmis virescens, Strain PCC157" /NCGR_SAMPLE_ID=MMETSP1356 /ASSEMBLY_ACC=CAM_ASM_000847 /LENGTH=52 /DNA_ID=CAMNT_0014341095 /DNA_START=261 /DNA_END=419 /DNA_ORIENTATION=-